MKKVGLSIIVVLFLLSCGQARAPKGVVFRIVNGADPQSLDPAKIQGVPEHRVMQALFEGLMTYDAESSDPVLGLAEAAPQISSDGLTYTFRLKEGLTWSDGVPLTAADFEYGFKRTLNPETGSKYGAMLYPIVGAEAYNSGNGTADGVGVRVLDDRTLEISLRAPTAYFESLLCHYTYLPHPRHVIEKHKDDWTKPTNMVSNGAFKLKSWARGSRVEVVKNELFYDAENIKLDTVVYYTTDDSTTGYNMFRQGEADWNTGMFPTSVVDEVRLHKDTHVNATFANNHYLMNTQKAPFDDARVRRAFAMALDMAELTEKVLKNGSVATTTLVPPLAGYAGARGNGFNPAAAKILLAEAGYPDGQGFPAVQVLYNTNDTHRVAAEWAQDQWKRHLGIDVALRNEEWKVFLESRGNQNFDIARAGWSADYTDPMSFLELFLSYSAMNDGRYNSPAFDRLVEQGQSMRGGAARFQVLSNAENLLLTEDQALIPVYNYANVNLIDLEKWGGWSENILDIHPIKTIYPK
ncbi:MAG: peptide ABC transporter substrate-binding protein [Spirochaetia bacterium]